MIIFGVDPGIAIVGVAVIEYDGVKSKPLFYDAITTDASAPLPQRLLTIYEKTSLIIKTFKPDAVAVEELFFNQNAKTAFSVGQARGIIILCCTQYNIPFFEYTPLQVKQAVTGYGRADKNQIQHMIKTLLGLSQIPKPDDAADALAIALCHAHSHKMSNILGINKT
ncbi:MAG: crossover junction endodeoxyribonuclease RuvC [Clostridiaceae bacterium]|nr:crossover junction endodeoxyribonuclease RuvC [Clostridiaceae bacterium]